MPTLTKRFIEQIKSPERGQIFFRDKKVPGLAIRATKGSKSYVVERRVKGVNCRITIGKAGELPLAAARTKAYKLLAEMSSGCFPKAIVVPRITLTEVLQKYLSTKQLRPNTIRTYKQILNRCLGDWLNKPVTTISRAMIENRHRELTRKTKQGTSGKVQANMAIRILGAMLKFAADNYEASDGSPLLTLNPVRRFSQNKAWHRENRRQTVIADAKLLSWYQAIIGLKQTVVADYLLFLLLTGLRRNEAATLKWTAVDMDQCTITITGADTKNYREHSLPLTEFLSVVLRRRKSLSTSKSEFVFPGQGGRHHIIDAGHVIERVESDSGCSFTLHDLRRTFLTMAARLQIPYHVIKKLANHVVGNDVTLGYFIMDVHDLREPMEKITDRFLELMEVNRPN